MGKERCCLQGIDYLHGPTSHSICGNFLIYKPSLTNDRLMFEDDESLRVDLLPINFPASYENGKLEHFLHRWMKNREHKNFWLTMFPEKRYFQETTNTTEVAIHTNPFTDLYAPIGTSSSRTGVPLFSVSKPCSACSKVFARDIYGDHDVSCAGITGIKHRHNVVRDTLVDICFRSGISAGKEVDIGLGGGCDKPLRPADMLLYSWDEGLDVCADLTGSSHLTQTGMVDFVSGRAMIDAAHCKRVQYEAKCTDIGYGFLPFSFSLLGELEKDATTLLKRIRKFSMTQDIGARAAVHIFNIISFAIAKGLRAQITRVWRLEMEACHLTLCIWGLGVYSACDVLNYVFLASRLQSVGLQTKLLRHAGIGGSGSSFEDALCVFNTNMGTDLLSNQSVPLFSISKPCSTFSRVFTWDIYRDHAVSCAGIIGIKHSHNVVRDTLVDICYRSGISTAKEVDIGSDGGRDKPLRPTNMLIYSWDRGMNVCVDLTWSPPLTQTGMTDFVTGRAVIDAAHRKRVKYETKCEAIGYGFVPFSFSYLGELEEDDVTLLKRIRKFSMTQDIRAHATV
ncbi:hypothetical protein Tco_1456762 [Tanacetum coccineum]